MSPNRLAMMLALFASILDAPHTAHAKSSLSTQQPCDESKLSPIFEHPEAKDRLRVLVLDYQVTSTSEQGGSYFPDHLQRALTHYLRHALAMDEVGLSMANVEINRLGCYVSDPGHALRVGKRTGADAVFWGQESPQLRQRPRGKSNRAGVNAPITIVIDKSPGSNVNVGYHKYQSIKEMESAARNYYSNIAISSHIGLSKESSHQITAEVEQELVGRDLPRLVSRDIKLLFDFSLGMFAFRIERYGLAIALMEQNRSQIPAGTERQHELFQLLGRSHVLAGNLQEGEAALREALARCPVGSWECQGVQHTYLGWAQIFLGKPAEATTHLQEAVALLTAERDYRGLGAALHNLGLLELVNRRYPTAGAYFEQSLRTRISINDTHGEILTRNNIALIKQATGDLPAAKAELVRVFDYFQRIAPSVYGMGRSANNLGLLYMRLEDSKSAQQFFYDAINSSTQSGDFRTQVKSRYNRGRLYSSLGQFEDAMKDFSKAMRIQKEKQDHLGLVYTYFEMGLLQTARNDLMSAIVQYNLALAEISAIKFIEPAQIEHLRSIIQHNLSIAYFDSGALHEAKIEFASLVKRDKFLDASQRATMYKNYAETLLASQEYKLAIENLELAAKNLHEEARYREEYLILSRIGDLHLAQKRIKEGQETRKRASDLRDLFIYASPLDQVKKLPDEIKAAQEAEERKRDEKRIAELLGTSLPVDHCGHGCTGGSQPPPTIGITVWTGRADAPSPTRKTTSRVQPMKLPPIDVTSPFLRYSPAAETSQPAETSTRPVPPAATRSRPKPPEQQAPTAP